MYQSGVDGLLYQSAVYIVTGSMQGCNLVLNTGRSTQVEALSYHLSCRRCCLTVKRPLNSWTA